MIPALRRVRFTFVLFMAIVLAFAIAVPQASAQGLPAYCDAGSTYAPDVATLIAAMTLAAGTVANETICLTQDGLYILATVNNTDPIGPGATGLPRILPATGTLTIDGNNATITRDANALDFRHFLVVTNARLTLNDLTLSNGRADNGGSVVNGGTLILNRVRVIDNTATGVSGGDNGDGGGLITLGGTVAINDSTFSGNTALDDGGAIYNYLATTTVTGSTLSGNTATNDRGGAINNLDATLVVTNSTISGNSAGSDGGGVRSFGASTASFTNATFTGNDAANGGGLYLSGTTTNLYNTLVIGNTADSAGAEDCATFVLTNSSSNLSGAGTGCGPGGFTTAASAASVLDPALADNGGLTETHALLPGSPAINAGGNGVVSQGTDQRGAGFPRIVDTTVDIGAFEATPAIVAIQLALQGRPAAPNDQWMTTVHLRLYLPGGATPFYDETFTADANGQIAVPLMTTGIYDMVVKGTHSLARRIDGVVLNAGANNLSPATLLEGDATDDNLVNISDFSVLAAAFGTNEGGGGFNAQADFNDDAVVNISDFSLLAANFLLSGE
ncbi:MAG: hypothetical protein IPK19_30045 [Chloroflexi bacterium]|nr:hypothetical protein [Chloroflexota bacterium]